MPKINSLEVVHQDTNKDSYDNLHDILVALKDAVGLSKEDGNYLVNKEVIDGQARAAYEVLLEMYVNDKEAFARRLETLTAEFGTSIAKVLEEWTVYASATEAYAKKIEEVSVKAFKNAAKVTEEMYARVTADEAIAKLVTTLRADFENAQARSRAAIREEQMVRANADEALASRSFVMEASIADNNAMIIEEQTVRATADEALATDLSTLSATVGSKNKTYYQSNPPTTGVVAGDLWIDLDDNKLYRYDGSIWINVQDSAIGVNAAAITSEASARATADSANATSINALTARLDTGDFATVKTQAEAGAVKNKTYRQATAPANSPIGTLLLGDLWFDTDDYNKVYRWDGSSWTTASDTSGLTTWINSTYTSDIASISAQVDSKVETWFQTSDPSSAWTTTPLRNQHDRDLWYDSTTNLFKVYTASTNTWTTIEDQAAINAASAASTAQDTADGKITTFIQTSEPVAEGVGDLWLNSDDNRKMYRWNGSSWVAVDDSRIATTYSRWGVQTTAIGGGKTAIAGIQLNSDSTGTSEFTVLADNFRVYKSGNTSSPMFDVGTVNGVTTVGIKGNLVVDGSIITRGLGSNTATISASNSIVNTSSTSASVTFSVSGLAAGEQVPITISVGIIALASCGVAIYLNSSQLSLDGYTAGQLGYISASTLVGNGTHSASISTDLTGSGSRRLSVFVAVSKR